MWRGDYAAGRQAGIRDRHSQNTFITDVSLHGLSGAVCLTTPRLELCLCFPAFGNPITVNQYFGRVSSRGVYP